ncbi:MAG: sigma-70 domain-containing protein [Lachnospiraceae bacterium]
MNREIEFAKTLERVRKMAADQGGMISKEQVQQAFAELELSEEQLALVFDYLKKHKVGIGEPVNLDDYLTEEEHDYLKEYLEALSGIEQVSDGQREAYILSAMAGDKDAQSSLIQIFLPQVAEIAKLYTGQGVYLEDLIGQGNMAVSEGVTMLGCQENAADAEGMLVKMIMDSMEEMIQSDMEAFQSDQKLADKVNEIAQKAKELADEMRRKVTVAELAEETGIPEEEILDVYRMSGYAIEDIDGGSR